MTNCLADSDYKITCLFGVKYVESVRYCVHVERVGGIPYRYWVVSEFMRTGPFTTREEACLWCHVMGVAK